MLEGWGMTETTGVGTVATQEHFMFGTVGRAVPGVELRISEDGEIAVRTCSVSTGAIPRRAPRRSSTAGS
ncbi:MAG: hypothetical protein WBP81_39310 [Solirubrobacteraceae bacterium]